MKTVLATLIFMMCICSTTWAQPFTLDKDLKPFLLELKPNENGKGKLVITNADLNSETLYYYVKGHTMFEFVDVYVFSNYNNASFTVELVDSNWKDVVYSENTATAEEGIVNFKFRDYGDFGIRIIPGDEAANITIAASTTEPSKTYLPSPFVKMKESEAAVTNTAGMASQPSGTTGESTPMWMYIALGVAGLLIALLAGVLLGRRKKSVSLLLLLLWGGFAMAQQHDGVIWHDKDTYEDWLDSERPSNSNIPNPIEMGKRWDKFEKDLSSNTDKAVGMYTIATSMYDKYQGLTDCLSNTPPPGAPSIPSFCETQQCKDCFVDARNLLQENRYTFEQLKTIYSCTSDFANTAIAFGNSFSTLPGGSGIGWSFQRIKIEKSLKTLKKSYDKKYNELLSSQFDILMMLNDCEAQHGIPDWYDRFGHLLHEYTSMAYKRPN
ncbi:LPXTG cell wall anchor domain-containing protein [Luteirhabdus pelagi]|uniref:LPXTG cell wall anchor domain-containing protein n=1 Tax=Luteirhabdus pelagi TaxID=2792783 RepID=UPI001939EA41|nr:LPXTG cell wall anchor domain-containing protein [Luteirhabdus pelagi]